MLKICEFLLNQPLRGGLVPEEASHSIFFPMYFQIFIKFGTAKKPSKGPQMALNVLV